MSVIQNIEVSVSEGLICEIGIRLRPLMCLRIINDGCFSGVQQEGLQYSVGMAKLSVERGFLSIASVQLGTDNCPLYGSGVSAIQEFLMY